MQNFRCLYCGGAQTIEHPACLACGAIARFVHCAVCAAIVPAGDETCRCGAPLHPGLKPAPPSCPRCSDRTLVVRRLSDGVSSALQCEACHGCFVRAHDWALVVDDAAGGHTIDTTDFVLQKESDRLPAERLIANASCPACHKTMDRFHFGLRSPAVVDICEDHGLWVDAGELAEVLAVAGSVAKSEHLPPETDAERRDMQAFEANLASEEREFDQNVDIARANFRINSRYRIVDAWETILWDFSRLLRGG